MKSVRYQSFEVTNVTGTVPTYTGTTKLPLSTEYGKVVGIEVKQVVGSEPHKVKVYTQGGNAIFDLIPQKNLEASTNQNMNDRYAPLNLDPQDLTICLPPYATTTGTNTFTVSFKFEKEV
jgi:predicted PhzF superfamily epimerase YddE/YHI9